MNVLCDKQAPDQKTGKTIVMTPSTYNQAIKAVNCFNLLDARGIIPATERRSYILRVRTLAKACGKAFLQK